MLDGVRRVRQMRPQRPEHASGGPICGCGPHERGYQKREPRPGQDPEPPSRLPPSIDARTGKQLRITALDGFVAKEQLLERGGDRVPLLLGERFEEYLVDGDQFMKRLLGDLAALRGETDEHPAPVNRIGRAADERGSFEAVQP